MSEKTNNNEKQNELAEEYIVVKNYDNRERYYITKRDNFAYIPICETYDRNGIPLSHDANCDSEDEDDHYEVIAWNFFDGSHWNTIFFDNGFGGAYYEIDNEESEAILNEMPKTPYLKGATEKIETENYCFYFSKYKSNPWICEVE